MDSFVAPEQPIIPSSSPAPKSKRQFVFVILGVLILALIGGGAFAYTYYFPSAEKVMSQVVINLDDVKAVNYSGQIRISLDAEKIASSSSYSMLTMSGIEIPSKIIIDFSGTTDYLSADDHKNSLIIKPRIETAGSDASTQNMEVELRSIKKISYLSFNNLPKLGEFDLGTFNQQWIKIDPEALRQEAGNSGVNVEVASDNNLKVLLSAETRKDLVESKAFVITDSLPADKIEGVDMRRYAFTLDEEAMKVVLKRIQARLDGDEATSTDEVKQKIDFSDGEIWIGKQDSLPHKIIFKLTYSGGDDKDYIKNLELELNLNNYNQPASIEAPTEAKSLEEMVGSIFASFMGEPENLGDGTMISIPDQEAEVNALLILDDDGDGLNGFQELMYSTNPYEADSDGDTYLDGAEVLQGYNPAGLGSLALKCAGPGESPTDLSKIEGDLAVEERSCCGGLKLRNSRVVTREGTDFCEITAGMGICVMCGDHRCDTDSGENICNCAEDCSISTPVSLE